MNGNQRRKYVRPSRQRSQNSRPKSRVSFEAQQEPCHQARSFAYNFVPVFILLEIARIKSLAQGRRLLKAEAHALTANRIDRSGRVPDQCNPLAIDVL